MDLQNEKCVMVIDENLPLGIIEIVHTTQKSNRPLVIHNLDFQ